MSLETIQQSANAIAAFLAEEFFKWLIEALHMVVDHIIIPMKEAMETHAVPLITHYTGNFSSDWIIPLVVVGWYGPTVILLALQCMLTAVGIFAMMVRLFFN